MNPNEAQEDARNEAKIEHLMEIADREFPDRGPLVSECGELITKLRDEKGLTYSQIADWLSKKLGEKVNRSTVFRVYQEWKSDPENRVDDESAPLGVAAKRAKASKKATP